MSGSLKVRCPSCHWEPPENQSFWECEACGMEFDMFADLGRCPRCGHHHEQTPCIPYAGGCAHISPHLAWYEGLDEGLKEINIRRRD